MFLNIETAEPRLFSARDMEWIFCCVKCVRSENIGCSDLSFGIWCSVLSNLSIPGQQTFTPQAIHFKRYAPNLIVESWKDGRSTNLTHWLRQAEKELINYLLSKVLI